MLCDCRCTSDLNCYIDMVQFNKETRERSLTNVLMWVPHSNPFSTFPFCWWEHRVMEWISKRRQYVELWWSYQLKNRWTVPDRMKGSWIKVDSGYARQIMGVFLWIVKNISYIFWFKAKWVGENRKRSILVMMAILIKIWIVQKHRKENLLL